jgi:hypothetical protein
MISQGKRRFWVLAVVFTTLIGAGTALSSLVVHFTQQGDNKYGCTAQSVGRGGKLATNQVCTREMGACNFLSKTLSSSGQQLAVIACNETVSRFPTHIDGELTSLTGNCEMAPDCSHTECACPVSYVRYAGKDTEKDQRCESTREEVADATSRVLGRRSSSPFFLSNHAMVTTTSGKHGLYITLRRKSTAWLEFGVFHQ